MAKSLIKPSRRGLLHEKLGVPKGEKIPAAKLAIAKASKSPAERKEATFAENFSKSVKSVSAAKMPKAPKAPETMREHFGDNEISRSIAQHEREQAKAR